MKKPLLERRAVFFKITNYETITNYDLARLKNISYLWCFKNGNMSDIKYKNISPSASRILTCFIEKGQAWFTLSDAYLRFREMSETQIRIQMKRMTDEGLLMRIRDGVYYIIPFEQDSATFLPDWHLLAAPLAGKDYYIGYYSAMQVHQLITQPSLKERIVVKKQIKPSETEIKGVKFQFIYHNEKHFFGCKKTWIDSFNRVWCSDLEKTLIDCLYKPEYAGGIVEIAKAIFMAKNKADFGKLLKYVMLFNSQAVIKRLGYLLELLEIETPIIETLQNQRSSSVSALDTEAPKQGKILSRWNIQQNIDKETIQSAILT
jgi:predicted transcriptional regulator of viral defense system